MIELYKRIFPGKNLSKTRNIKKVSVSSDALQYAKLFREIIEEYCYLAIFKKKVSYFTSDVFIKFFVDYDIRISIDGKEKVLKTSEWNVFGEASRTRISKLDVTKQ